MIAGVNPIQGGISMLWKMGAVALVAFGLLTAGASAATIKVTTTTDELNADGDCSLREAVQSANTNTGVDECAKGQGSKRDTIKLKAEDYDTLTSTDEDSNANGDFDVTGGGPVTVLGRGRDNTAIIDGTDEDRLFDVVDGDADLTLDALRVSSGDVTPLPFAEARGGNVRAIEGKLTIRNSEVTGGDANIGGGVVGQNDARVNISNSLFDSNDATGAGGSLALESTSKSTVKRTTFQLSEVDSAAESVEGGIIAAAGDKLTILDSTLQGSVATATGGAHAAFGGAIWINGNVTVKRSLIQGNSTSAGEDGVGEHGGGIFVAAGDLKVVNSTLFNNTAGIGIDNDGDGGGVFVFNGSAELSHVTMDANNAGDLGDALGALNGTLLFRQSLIEDSDDVCDGTPIFSGGFNVTEEDDAGCDFVPSDAPDALTGLGSVSDNGGPTDTIPISAASLAKNRVPKGVCKEHTGFEDQRKFVRPKGKKCDAGAFELGAKKK
jgi:CSLREA domain-containing protein